VESGLVTERVLRPEDVRSARAIYLANALRGLWRVALRPDQSGT
jgi:branched-subunit amino acid aminotransferase/4-amino-4-deoxychorismate lyase